MSNEEILSKLFEKERFRNHNDLLALYHYLVKLGVDKKVARGSRLNESTGNSFAPDDELVCERITYSPMQKAVIVSIMENYFPDDASRKLSSHFFHPIPGYERLTASILRKWISRDSERKSYIPMCGDRGIAVVIKGTTPIVNEAVEMDEASISNVLVSDSIFDTISNFATHEDYTESKNYLDQILPECRRDFTLYHKH